MRISEAETTSFIRKTNPRARLRKCSNTAGRVSIRFSVLTVDSVNFGFRAVLKRRAISVVSRDPECFSAYEYNLNRFFLNK